MYLSDDMKQKVLDAIYEAPETWEQDEPYFAVSYGEQDGCRYKVKVYVVPNKHLEIIIHPKDWCA